jgi:hypothetical protein
MVLKLEPAKDKYYRGTSASNIIGPSGNSVLCVYVYQWNDVGSCGPLFGKFPPHKSIEVQGTNSA